MPYSPPSLSPEQAAEFPGEDLGRFALDWLTFRRSSPCTSEKKSFPYFTLPKDHDMHEEDVLYGPDREQAYRRLMWSFRKCQRAHAFDRYFDAAHRQYYESRALPGLVLLKEWSTERTSAPGLYLSPLRAMVPEAYDEVWVAVRDPRRMPADPVGNMRHVPQLAPSKSLEGLKESLQKSGAWNSGGFGSVWAPAYLKEMLEPEPMAALRELYRRSRRGPVLVASQELDGSLGHRMLVGRILGAMQAREEEKENEDAENKKAAAAV